MDDDDPEKRIAELERGISADGYPPPLPASPPPPPPSSGGWETYTSQAVPWTGRPTVVKRSGLLRLLPLIIVVTAVVPVVIGVIVYFAGSDAFTDKPQLHTVDGLSGLVASIRDHFGDTTGYELVVYSDYAILYRPSPTNEHAKQSFMYRGEWEKWSTDSSVGSFDHLADLSRFDAADVSAALTGAADRLGIHDATATYLIVDGAGGAGGFRKGGDATDLSLAVHVSAPASGWMEINPDGSVIALHPPGG